MSFRDRYKAKKKDLQKRHEESANRSRNTRFNGIINKESIPDGIEFFRCGEGTHSVDILPFILSDTYPESENGHKPGDIVYMLDLYVHTNVGRLQESSFVCLWENFGKPCPICDYLAQLKKEGRRLSKEEFVSYLPKRRNLFLVWCHDSPKEEAKGIQIWDVAHFFMGENLDEIAKNPAKAGQKAGGYIMFEDLDEGKTVVFNKKGTGKGNVKFIGHRLVDRDQVIPDEIVDKIFPLDTCVNLHITYEEVEKVFAYDPSEDGGNKEESIVPDDDESQVDEMPEEEEIERDLKAEIPECFGKRNGEMDECPACEQFDNCFDSSQSAPKKEVKKAAPKKEAPKKAEPKEEGNVGQKTKRRLMRRK